MTLSAIQNPDLVVRKLDGELVIYDRARDVVHNLNTTARIVWENCDENLDIEHLTQEFTARFSISDEAARRDVKHTLGQLEELGLIRMSDGG